MIVSHPHQLSVRIRPVHLGNVVANTSRDHLPLALVHNVGIAEYLVRGKEGIVSHRIEYIVSVEGPHRLVVFRDALVIILCLRIRGTLRLPRRLHFSGPRLLAITPLVLIPEIAHLVVLVHKLIEYLGSGNVRPVNPIIKLHSRVCELVFSECSVKTKADLGLVADRFCGRAFPRGLSEEHVISIQIRAVTELDALDITLLVVLVVAIP